MHKFKLNTNGASHGNPEIARGGRLLETIMGNRSKASQDTWVAPTISRLKSRLYVMGYYWLKTLKFHILFVELDSSAMVKLMLSFSTNALMGPLLTNCKNMIHAIPNKKIRHVFQKLTSVLIHLLIYMNYFVI